VVSAEPSWADLYRLLPPEFHPYALELAWDHELLWALDLPVDVLPVAELSWQLTLPWWRDGQSFFVVRPTDVLESPERHPDHAARTRAADLTYPLDVTLRAGRWFILDGVHRLLKAAMIGADAVKVRKVPAATLREIARR
jgi:hypothetical protein